MTSPVSQSGSLNASTGPLNAAMANAKQLLKTSGDASPTGGASPSAGTKPQDGEGALQARVKHELDRIHEGLKKGWLTKDQAEKLEKSVKDVSSKLTSDVKGGQAPSADEKSALESQLNGTSGDIFEQKQTGRVNKLVKDGKLSQSEANNLISSIQQSATGVRANGAQLGTAWHALQHALHKAEGKKTTRTSQMKLPDHHPLHKP